MIKNKKKHNIIFFTVILIGMIAFIPSPLLNIINVNNDSKIDDTQIDNDIKTKIPTLSKYISTYNGSGGAFNVSLHQSLINNTGDDRIEIVNTSDSNNITFYEKCPTDINFNSSLINITIEDIFAPNKTLVVEDDYTGGAALFQVNNHYLSFNASGVGNIANISLRVYLFDTEDPSNLTLTLFNSTSDHKPNAILGTLVANSELNASKTDFYWHKMENVDFQFDSSKTYDDMFFIRIQYLGGSGINIDYASDTGGVDAVDESLVYRIDKITLEYLGVPANTIDFPLIIDFFPLNNTPNPTNISLKINDDPVSGYSNVNGSGYWYSTKEYSSSSGNLKFNITAEWWDVSCNITKAQLNYTKTDITANSEFNISGNNSNVFWNVTIDNINDFGGSYYNNSYINYTIPSNWTLHQAFQGSNPKNNETWNRGDGWQIVKVWEGGNEKFWWLNISSPNFITSIGILVGGVPKTSVYSSDIVSFNATFRVEIEGADKVNLTVYSPSQINNYMNYTFVNDSISPAATVVNLSDWDVSDNVTAYGIFRVRVFWNNGTAAGFYKENLTIVGSTDLSITYPEPNIVWFSDEYFNITIFYNDTNNEAGISGADIEYNFGAGFQSTNLYDYGSGYYNITIYNWQVRDYGFGLTNIQINASKIYFENQTNSYSYYQYNVTTRSIDQDTLGVIRGTNATFTVHYMWNDSTPISGANLELISIDPNFISSWKDNGDGSYDLILNTSNVIGKGSNSYGITFNISSLYNETQIYAVNLFVYNRTELIITYPEQSIDWYSDDIFNITIYYNDTDNEAGISGADIEYDFGAGFQSTNLFDYGNGYYNITIYNWQVRDYGFGLTNIQIDASKIYFVNQTKSYNYYLYNATTQSIDQDTLGVIRGTNATFTVHYMWNDSTPISGANLELISIDPNFISSWKDNGDGSYDLILNTSNVLGQGSTPYVITFNISSLYNETQVYSINLFVYNRTELIITYPEQNIDWLSDEYFNITIFYNDTDNEAGIAGADIEYNFGAGFQSTNLFDYGNGYYNITIYNWQVRDYGFGLTNIQINANKIYFENQTNSYSYYLYNATIQLIDQDTLGVIRGTNATFTVHYMWNDSTPISGANLELISIDPNFISSWKDNGDGSYDLILNTSNVLGQGSTPYVITFNISSLYNETQVYSINLFVYNRTELILILPDRDIEIYSEVYFNITIFYNDIDQQAGIVGASIEYDINGNGYQSTNITDCGNGYYNITIFAGDIKFDYGYNIITINANKTYYNNQTLKYWFHKVIRTNITIFPDLYIVIRGTNATFQINYTNIDGNTIENAIIQVININPNFEWSYKFENGNYTIELDTTNVNVGPYMCTFNITAVGNETQIFNLNVEIFQIQTGIIIIDYNGTLVRWQGFDQSIIFYFNDTDNNVPITGVSTFNVIVYNGSNPTQKWQGGTGDNWTLIALPALGPGYYRLNVSIIGLNSGTYSMILNVSYFPNYNWSLKSINFYIRGNFSDIGLLEVTNLGGPITPTDGNYTTFIESDINIEFNFTDSENGGVLIEDLLADPTDDATYFIVYEKGIEYGVIFHTLFYDQNTNTHIGSLDISSLALGVYNITIHVSRINYENATLQIIIIIGSKYDVNATLIDPQSFVSEEGTYKIRIKIEYTPGVSIWYLLPNVNIRNVPIFNGLTQPQILNSTNLQGFVEFTITAQIGIQNLTFSLTILTTYYTIERSMQFSIILSKYDVNATLIDPPDAVIAGEPFKIRALIEYLDENSIWRSFSGAVIECVPIIDGVEQVGSQNTTNSFGIVEFTITVPLEAQNITLKFIILTSYNTNEKSMEFSSISINPPAVIPIEIILVILIIGAIVAVGAISYKGIVVPRKVKKREAIMEVATAFDDAINLEQLLVLYKRSGTCIFFKSLGAETIDPDLISGFLSAVQSFGKEIKYQQSLNEITYGDKMLLLSDGNFIRVALVLGKKGSMILRRNLTRYIKMFEGRFGHILPEWRGDLHEFHDSDDLVDQAFNTSIILPHEISADTTKIKLIKTSLTRRLLKLAQNLTAEKERKYFFLASLINEATDKAGEETAELFVAIKELRDNEVIIPIHIEKVAIEAISQQEINIIGQRVAQLSGYTPEQKQNLIQELSHMSPAEREAFFSSLVQEVSIVSAPIKAEEGAAEVTDTKSAKKEMKNLESKAKELIKEGDLLKAIQIYENTAILAETWNYSKESKIFKEKAREVTIKHLESELKEIVKDAQIAVKSSNYSKSSEKYLQAARKASEIFKLGVSGIEKQVREYENKAREYEKYV